jgi:hypothetical protein
MASVLLVRDPSRVRRHVGSLCAPVSAGTPLTGTVMGLLSSSVVHSCCYYFPLFNC